MSGGRFNYVNDSLCHDIYGWQVSPNYGDKGFGQSELAARIDPFDDRLISELVFDVFCLIHSYDWCVSGDTSEEDYREDVARFKAKWVRGLGGERVKQMIDAALDEQREKLYRALAVEGGDSNGIDGEV